MEPMTEEFCDQIQPGKKNAREYGCIKQEGHSGRHVSGRNVSWASKLPALAGGEEHKHTPIPVWSTTHDYICSQCGESVAAPEPATPAEGHPSEPRVWTPAEQMKAAKLISERFPSNTGKTGMAKALLDLQCELTELKNRGM